MSGRYIQKHPEAVLIHGSILGPGTNKRIHHAWVENGEESYDPVMDEWYPKKIYDQIFNTKIENKYNQLEVLKNIVKTGHWGPW